MPASAGSDRKTDPLDALRRHIETRAEDGINPTDPPALRLKKRFLPSGLRQPLRLAATSLQRPAATLKLRRLQSMRPLLLNLGSGYNPKDGWVNIDLFGAPTDLAWDLTRGIPFS